MIPRRRSGPDEAIASFVTRRFGREAYDWLIEPLLSGIFAGDGEQLSLGATFPQLAQREREQGSVLLPMLRDRFRRRAPGPPVAGFVTPETGLAEMVEALEQALPADRIWRNARARELAPTPSGWRVGLEDGRMVEARALIVAIPAFAAAGLLAPVDAELSTALGGIRFVSTATVSVAFPRQAVPEPLGVPATSCRASKEGRSSPAPGPRTSSRRAPRRTTS